jgi:hypothetical protein
MYLPHPYDLLSADSVRRYLAEARTELEAFHAHATPADGVLMDRLLLTRAVLLVGMRADRARMGAGRMRFEKALDDTEQEFMQLQLLVQTCPTFAAMPPAARRAIEQAVFQLAFPNDPAGGD